MLLTVAGSDPWSADLAPSPRRTGCPWRVGVSDMTRKPSEADVKEERERETERETECDCLEKVKYHCRGPVEMKGATPSERGSFCFSCYYLCCCRYLIGEVGAFASCCLAGFWGFWTATIFRISVVPNRWPDLLGSQARNIRLRSWSSSLAGSRGLPRATSGYHEQKGLQSLSQSKAMGAWLWNLVPQLMS